MAAVDNVAIRKRSQIAKANRTMFLWIAASSALVGAAVVVSIFLGQSLFYNEEVLAAKSKTASTLEANLNAVEDLTSEIRVLDTNQDLASVKANSSDQTLQVVLDALPSEANSLALGASLQSRLLVGIPELQPIDMLHVDSVSTNDDETVVDATTDTDAPQNSISFSFAVTGTQDAIQQLLRNLERSIRTIDVTSMRIETQQDGRLLLSLSGRAFYEPARALELRKEVVPR